jgi:hypothetical protein
MTDIVVDVAGMTDREKLVAVAKGYHDLLELLRQQQATQAKMIRCCLAAVNRHQRPHEVGDWKVAQTITRERKAALEGLATLASMLEAQSVGSSDNIKGTDHGL